MKSGFRTLSAIAIAAVLTFSVAPAASAGPRENPADLPSQIVRIIKKFQKIFGITAQDNEPVPPRPGTGS